MLSRVQEAQVLELLGNCPADSVRTYCLEHLAGAIKIAPAHAGDLVMFLHGLRAKDDCEIQYGGFCDAEGHDTDDLLVWKPERPAVSRARRA